MFALFNSGLRQILAGTVVSLAVLASQAASATVVPPVNWGNSFLLRVDAGVEDILVRFGFNPQPEPPPGNVLGPALSINRGAASLSQGGVFNPQQFQVFFSVHSKNGSNVAYPTIPSHDFPTLQMGVDTGLQTVLFNLNFNTSSGGMASGFSARAFNPQPEPPATILGPGESFGLEFEFTSLSVANVSLSVTDQSGGLLPISAVPAPLSVVMLLTSFAGLAWIARQKRR